MNKLYTILLLLLLPLFLQSETWEKLDGPQGGKVIDMINAEGTAIALVQNDSHSSVYRSSDKGDKWELILDSWKGDKGLYSIAYHKGALFVGTNIWVLVKSTDMGNTWEQTGEELIDEHDLTARISHLATNDEMIVLGTQNGRAFSSIDAGDTWNELSGFPITRITAMTFHEGTLYIGLNIKGIWKTDDNGNNWTEFNSGFNLMNSSIIEIRSLGGNLFAMGGNIHAVLNEDKSTWEKIEGLEFPLSKIGYDGEYYYIPAFKKIFISNDLKTWEEKNVSANYGSENCFLNLGDTFLAGNSLTGVYRTTDNGDTWEYASKGITVTNIKSIFVDNDGNIYSSNIMADFGFPSKSSDKGENWEPLVNGISVIGTKDIVRKGEYIYAGTEGSGVYRSSNKGDTWESKSVGISSGYMSRLAASENYIFAGTVGFSQGVFRSSDNGESWESIETLSKSDTEDIIYDESSKKLYANVKNLVGVFVSDDEGDTWTNIFNPSEHDNAWINCIDVKDSLIVLGTFNKGFYISKDGKNFERSTRFAEEAITDIKIIDELIYIALKNGKFYRLDAKDINSNVYEMYDDLPTAAHIINLEFDGKYLYGGTNGLGLWRVDISGHLTSVDKDMNVDNRAKVYPNPFKNRLTIEMNSEVSSPIDISLFNIGGIEVYSFEISINNGKINLDKLELIPGLYILKIETENDTFYKKLIKEE